MSRSFVFGATLVAAIGLATSANSQLFPGSSAAEVARAQQIARTLCKYEPAAAAVVKVGAAINPIFGLAASGTAHLAATAICDAVNQAGGAKSLGRKAVQVYGIPVAGRLVERVRARKQRIRSSLSKRR